MWESQAWFHAGVTRSAAREDEVAILSRYLPTYIQYTSTSPPHQTQATQVGPESSPVDIFTTCNSPTPSAVLATQTNFGDGIPNFAPPLRLLPLLLFQLPSQLPSSKVKRCDAAGDIGSGQLAQNQRANPFTTLTCWSPATCLALLPSSGPVSSARGRRQRASTIKSGLSQTISSAARHPHRSLIEQLELSPTIGSTAPEPPSESFCLDPCRDEGKRQSWGRTDVEGGVCFC